MSAVRRVERTCPECGAAIAFALAGRAWIPILAADTHLLKRSPKGALFYHRDVATHFERDCDGKTSADRGSFSAEQAKRTIADLRRRVAELEQEVRAQREIIVELVPLRTWGQA